MAQIGTRSRDGPSASELVSDYLTYCYQPWNNLGQLRLSQVCCEMSRLKAKKESHQTNVNAQMARPPAVQLPEETAVSKLRMDDFEKTNILILRVESRNVLFLTEPKKFIAMGSQAFVKWVRDHVTHIQRRAELHHLAQSPLAQPVNTSTQSMKVDEDTTVVWHDHDNIIAICWLMLSPWLNWARNFFGITADLTFHANKVPLYAWIGWVYLAVLAPLLFIFQVFYNIASFYKPEDVKAIVDGGNKLM